MSCELKAAEERGREELMHFLWLRAAFCIGDSSRKCASCTSFLSIGADGDLIANALHQWVRSAEQQYGGTNPPNFILNVFSVFWMVLHHCSSSVMLGFFRWRSLSYGPPKQLKGDSLEAHFLTGWPSQCLLTLDHSHHNCEDSKSDLMNHSKFFKKNLHVRVQVWIIQRLQLYIASEMIYPLFTLTDALYLRMGAVHIVRLVWNENKG